MAFIAIYRFWPHLWPKSGFADERRALNTLLIHP